MNREINRSPQSSLKIFNKDDANEEVDYNRYPQIFKGKSIDEIDPIQLVEREYWNIARMFSSGVSGGTSQPGATIYASPASL